jgi:hypothetical protein
LQALRAQGLRPLILLNANHLEPCPVKWRELIAVRNAAAGSRSLLAQGDLEGVEPLAASLMSLADGTSPGPLIERYSHEDPRVLELSKPLVRAVRAGERLKVAVLAYPPLHPVGTPEFERTVGGWLRYVALVATFVARHYGSDEFDVEIWNETTFGSGFLDIDNYRAPLSPSRMPEPFHRGGRVWELAQRTVTALHRDHPDVRVIWGFSNTSFFHVSIPELPHGLDGQSYHPYGTGRRCPADLVRGRERFNLDGRVPPGCIVQPEGYAHGWQQTESLLRLIAPGVRETHPPGSDSFAHYITEHGFNPAELGITDSGDARVAKAKFLLRAPLLWLNKGLTGLYVYNAYGGDDLGFGLFERGGGVSGGLRALRRLTGRFAGATAIAAPRQLTLAVEREAAAGVTAGGNRGNVLPQQDAVALLPFQVNAHKFIVGAYVMTQDFPAALAAQPYVITISGVHGGRAAVTYYAPDADAIEPSPVVARNAQALSVRVALTDVPRLIEIEELP